MYLIVGHVASAVASVSKSLEFCRRQFCRKHLLISDFVGHYANNLTFLYHDIYYIHIQMYISSQIHMYISWVFVLKTLLPFFPLKSDFRVHWWVFHAHNINVSDLSQSPSLTNIESFLFKYKYKYKYFLQDILHSLPKLEGDIYVEFGEAVVCFSSEGENVKTMPQLSEALALKGNYVFNISPWRETKTGQKLSQNLIPMKLIWQKSTEMKHLFGKMDRYIWPGAK